MDRNGLRQRRDGRAAHRPRRKEILRRMILMRSIESQRKENEMKCDIVHSVDIETTPDRLYEAITTQKGLTGWWTPQVKAEPTVGALNEFHFTGTTLKFRVDKLEPARHVMSEVHRTNTVITMVVVCLGALSSGSGFIHV
jgi:hypothetical protein